VRLFSASGSERGKDKSKRERPERRAHSKKLVPDHKTVCDFDCVKARIIDDRKFMRINLIRINLRSLRSIDSTELSRRSKSQRFSWSGTRARRKVDLSQPQPLPELEKSRSGVRRYEFPSVAQRGTQLPETRLNRFYMGPKTGRMVELTSVRKFMQKHILHDRWI